jgi:hypothetical protein
MGEVCGSYRVGETLTSEGTMGDICSEYQTRGQVPPTASFTREAALADVVIEVMEAAALPISAGARQLFVPLFEQTVGSFIARRGVDAWAGKTRSFILRRVRRIGEESGRLARLQGSPEIRAEHLSRGHGRDRREHPFGRGADAARLIR